MVQILNAFKNRTNFQTKYKPESVDESVGESVGRSVVEFEKKFGRKSWQPRFLICKPKIRCKFFLYKTIKVSLKFCLVCPVFKWLKLATIPIWTIPILDTNLPSEYIYGHLNLFLKHLYSRLSIRFLFTLYRTIRIGQMGWPFENRSGFQMANLPNTNLSNF